MDITPNAGISTGELAMTAVRPATMAKVITASRARLLLDPLVGHNSLE